jgi:hypothetical protein
MYPVFDVDGISVERLLLEWKWLVPGEFGLLAVSAFGDLFLGDVRGDVHWLNITSGKISRIAHSEQEFRDSATELSKKKEWFLTDDVERAARNGYSPVKGQCLGSKIPRIFKESTDVRENLYVADLYAYVSFMGDLHQQVHEVPDGGKVRIRVQPRPE